MNCELTRRRLLAAEHPARPGPDVKRHLAACPACRAWQQGLAALEAQVALLPVPHSDGKRRLLKDILAPAGAGAARALAPLGVVLPMPRTTPLKERGLQKLSLAVAVAAAVVLFAVGLALWPSGKDAPVARTPPTGPLHEYVQRLEERLHGVDTPRRRVEVVAQYLDALRREADVLALAATDADELAVVAEAYGRVVRDNLKGFARELSPGDRAEVLAAVAEQLGREESHFRQLASNAVWVSKGPLTQIADAAREGERDLRSLIQAA
jgi:hypothetical protein